MDAGDIVIIPELVNEGTEPNWVCLLITQTRANRDFMHGRKFRVSDPFKDRGWIDLSNRKI